MSSTTLKARGFLHDFLTDRLPGISYEPASAVVDIFDSLLFMDFFVHVELRLGSVVSLDELSGCRTLEELAVALARNWPDGEAR